MLNTRVMFAPGLREVGVHTTVAIIVKHWTKHSVQLLIDQLRRYVPYILQHVVPDT